MNKQSTVIRQATANDAKRVAELIIMAMTEECCLHFCGEEHNIDDFRNVLIRLVESDESQYSYLNTLCAVDAYNNIIGEEEITFQSKEEFQTLLGKVKQFNNDSTNQKDKRTQRIINI